MNLVGSMQISEEAQREHIMVKWLSKIAGAILQKRINKWQYETFDYDTRDKEEIKFALLSHFMHEVHEFSEDTNDPEEAADMMILLMGYSEINGWNLLEEVEKKFAINNKRQWGPPEKDGVRYHVKAN